VKDSESGERFDEILDLYMVYILDCFTVKELDNPTFPATTRKFRELKTTEAEYQKAIN